MYVGLNCLKNLCLSLVSGVSPSFLGLHPWSECATIASNVEAYSVNLLCVYRDVDGQEDVTATTCIPRTTLADEGHDVGCCCS